MPGTTDTPGPSYISSHSADVILSEVRPIKLKVEALRSINILLDEFLYNILSAASSLSTDRLRASLLALLPTTLGKEALLEAEVELRAYWERTGPTSAALTSPDDGSKLFHLQWVYKLLRLKCEAFSTLNESDEDPGAEEHIMAMMGSAGCLPPKPGSVAPAALYLTAILEALCEHILSNVGRVAARDSSRTSATIQDLFIALCEDHSIYTLFKSMKVYEEIEQLSKAPKFRRSKSLTRSDRTHSGSTHSDASAFKNGTAASHLLEGDDSNSRPSLEKTRAIKMFMNNTRTSGERDGEGQNDHKRSDSALSEHSRRNGTPPLTDEGSTSVENALEQQFDDLMRSSATMKVSLTPDRLRTMEVYKQERDQRGNRRLGSSAFQTNSEPAFSPPRAPSRKPTSTRVDAIKEDEEENFGTPPLPFPQPRIQRQTTESTSIDNHTASMTATPRVFVRETLASPHTSTSSPKFLQPGRRDLGKDSFPPRSRKTQRNRESLDLDDVMYGSDDDDDGNSTLKTPKPRPTAGTRRSGQPAVSAGTRELMDFLAEGPPIVGGASATDLLSEASAENGKSKGSGRLQKMISKLSLGGADKSKAAFDDVQRSKSSTTPTRQAFPSQSPTASVSSYLANRPTPPRPPPAPSISPTSSPSPEISQDHDLRLRSTSHVQSKQRPDEAGTVPSMPSREHSADRSTRHPNNIMTNGHHVEKRDGRQGTFVSTTSRAHSAGPTVDDPASPVSSYSHPAQPITPQTRRFVPEAVRVAPEPHISATDAKAMHRLISGATHADECRLILDMFLVKSGIQVDRTLTKPKVIMEAGTIPDDAIERSLVDFLLGAGNVECLDDLQKLTVNGTVDHPESNSANQDSMEHAFPLPRISSLQQNQGQTV